MLDPATPFPHVGSYALLIDEDKPLGEQRVELIRILRHNPQLQTEAFVSFPLREGASGNMTARFSAIIDATPLTGAEGREMVDLGRELRGSRVRDRAKKEARRDALESRARWAPLMLRLIDQAAKVEAKRRAA